MDPHRLSEKRSTAYHRAVAERLADQPEVFEAARWRVRTWSAAAVMPHYAREWERLLSGDPTALAAFLVERSPRADELRQSSPLADALPPRERWRICSRGAHRADLTVVTRAQLENGPFFTKAPHS